MDVTSRPSRTMGRLAGLTPDRVPPEDRECPEDEQVHQAAGTEAPDQGKQPGEHQDDWGRAPGEAGPAHYACSSRSLMTCTTSSTAASTSSRLTSGPHWRRSPANQATRTTAIAIHIMRQATPTAGSRAPRACRAAAGG